MTQFTHFIRKVFATKFLQSGKFSLFVTLLLLLLLLLLVLPHHTGAVSIIVEYILLVTSNQCSTYIYILIVHHCFYLPMPSALVLFLVLPLMLLFITISATPILVLCSTSHQFRAPPPPSQYRPGCPTHIILFKPGSYLFGRSHIRLLSPHDEQHAICQVDLIVSK